MHAWQPHEWRATGTNKHTCAHARAALFQISAAPINVGERCVGVLMLALDEDAVNAQSDVIV
jgi:hypothetical protein